MTNIIDKYDDLEILNIISEARNFTLSELVFRKIRSMILNGEILSGEKIHENNISDELNVSRGPVREATRRLSQIGLLEYTAQKGLKVKEFNINDQLVQRLQFLRCILFRLYSSHFPCIFIRYEIQ